MERRYRVGEVARLLGVSPTTVRRWILSGRIRAERTPGGHYRIPESEVRRLLGRPGNRAAIYARVSSSDRKEDLERQVQYLREYCAARGYVVVETITDIASGLNEERRGLNRLFKLVNKGLIDVVVIAYRDRLTRFGFNYLESYFTSHGVRIEAIFEEEPRGLQQELVEDLLAVVSSLAGRLYGMRSSKRKRVMRAVEQALRDC